MCFKQMIALFIALISMFELTKCSLNLCRSEGTPLTSFRTITKLVNDSYLITDRKLFSVFESQKFVNFTRKYSEIMTNDNNTLGKHDFSFDTIFVIDFDGNCVNVREKLFVVDSTEEKIQHKYVIYTNNSWAKPDLMTNSETGLEALNKINEEMEIFKSEFKLILYFRSFGLLVIKKDETALAYCTLNGWKVQKGALKSVLESSQKIDFQKIDAGFVDNDNKLVYLFVSDSIGSESQHIRSHYYNCSYNLSSSRIDLKCEYKSLESLCLKEKAQTLVTKTLSIPSIGLIVLVVSIVIVFNAVICLLFCPTKKKEGDGSEPSTSSTPRTLVDGNKSLAVSAVTDSDTKKESEVKLNL